MTYGVILSTISNINQAKKIAKKLVEEKFAACVNIVPKIISVYSWQNELCEDEEVLMIIKTRQELFEQTKNCILSNHPYAVPEIIMLPVINGLESYLNWIKSETNYLK
ncbi:MAG: divalent-cation tolerance protein CutA [Candidatus Gastranaerophilaceae bacterium]|jgi:periplasmic divalent cation tolerance protein